MDERATALAAFGQLAAERGYPVQPAAELPLSRPPFFVNASVTPYLDAMAAGLPCTRSAQVQPCFRVRPLAALPRVFTMLGLVAPAGDTTRVLADCAAYLQQMLPGAGPVLAACAATDADLIDRCGEAGLPVDASADESATRWQYGLGNRLVGRGVALVASTPGGARFVAGTVTVVTNTVALTDYVEAGIGLEPLLAARHDASLLALPPWAAVAAAAAALTSEIRRVADLVVAVATLAGTGTAPGPHGGGYLLRRLIAELGSALPDHAAIAEVFGSAPGGAEAIPVVLAELARRAEYLAGAERRARRWIRRAHRTGRPVTVQDLTATFGLPPATAALVLEPCDTPVGVAG